LQPEKGFAVLLGTIRV